MLNVKKSRKIFTFSSKLISQEQSWWYMKSKGNPGEEIVPWESVKIPPQSAITPSYDKWKPWPVTDSSDAKWIKIPFELDKTCEFLVSPQNLPK